MSMVAGVDVLLLLAASTDSASLLSRTGLPQPQAMPSNLQFAILALFIVDVALKLFAYKGFHHYIRWGRTRVSVLVNGVSACERGVCAFVSQGERERERKKKKSRECESVRERVSERERVLVRE